jgi:hypothetical protein
MRVWIVICMAMAGLIAGCAGKSKGTFDPTAPTGGGSDTGKRLPAVESEATNQTTGLIITPDYMLVGKVVAYHEAGRFVVLDFPLGQLPAADRRMFIYRSGLKVGEVRINSWQRGPYVVGDLVAGEAREGDEVRSK